jgi:hypothetical protein
VIPAVLLAGLVGNITQFSSHADTASSSVKQAILTAGQLPLARELPRSLQPEPFFAGEVTLGWLLDNEPTGRIPPPDHLTRSQIATATLRYVLQHSDHQQQRSCHALVRPQRDVARKGDVLTVKSGTLDVVYFLPGGGHSTPTPITHSSRIVEAGPLLLELTPATPDTMLCT